MAAIDDFAVDLRNLGYEPEIKGDYVHFDYEVPVGSRLGETVKLALRIPPDWPANPPSGPFVTPRLLPINPSAGQRPWAAVHEATSQGMEDAAGAWQYWSRPYPANPGWASTVRTVKTYMAHIRTLFAELPEADA